MRDLALNAWLPGSGAGVTRDEATVGGRDVTRIDYGDGQGLDYVLVNGDRVFIVSTGDAGGRRRGAQGAALTRGPATAANSLFPTGSRPRMLPPT